MSKTSSRSYLIPEWVEQSAVLLAWPDADGDFNPWLDEVRKTYISIAQAVTTRQSLIIACKSPTHRQEIEDMLARKGIDPRSLTFVIMPYDDVWVRDTAPLTVIGENGTRLLDFRFNGWGGKYAHSDDAQLAQRLHASGTLGHTPLVPVDFVLEGGSIETDGQGVVMTTTRCLLNTNRNPALSRIQIEDVLKTRLGADKILWLEHGHAAGDDTDAHIDTLARFCSPDTIAYTACDDVRDPMHGDFLAMARQLADFTRLSGQPYRLVPLPMPPVILDEAGNRLPATYANFLIINGAVLVPVYGDPADSIALERLAKCFPGRRMVAIDCSALIRQFGSLHCMTMQFPVNLRRG